jgi:hypothetical protein
MSNAVAGLTAFASIPAYAGGHTVLAVLLLLLFLLYDIGKSCLNAGMPECRFIQQQEGCEKNNTSNSSGNLQLEH